MAGLGEREPAGHRRAGVRAVLAGEAVDVEGDVHLARQRGDDVLAHLGPGGAVELAVAHVLVVEALHAALGALDELHLARADVADSHLHQLAHAGQARHHVVEDARVAPREALEAVAQVRVRVDLQDAHAGVAERELGDEAERAGVVAAEDGGDGAAVEDALGLARHVAVHALAGGIDRRDGLRVRLVAGDGAACLDDGLGRGTRLPAERGDVLRDGEHGNARLPDGAVLDVLEVHLLARLQHVRRAVGRSRAVAGGGVERHRDHHDARILGPRVEAEEAVTGGGGIGVEAGGDDGGLRVLGVLGVLGGGHAAGRIRNARATVAQGQSPQPPSRLPRSAPSVVPSAFRSPAAVPQLPSRKPRSAPSRLRSPLKSPAHGGAAGGTAATE